MKKRLYAVGPVEMYEETFPIGGSQVPYFRNQEFSDVVLYCMDGLKKLDPVAYVRFASVYRQFADLESFRDEIRAILNEENHPNS